MLNLSNYLNHISNKKFYIQLLDLKMFFKVLEHLKQLFRVKIIYMKIYYLSVGSDFFKCFE